MATFGRMRYSVHMMFYPAVYFAYSLLYKPYAAKSSEEAATKMWNEMPPAKKVDKTLFNPYTPIPYHNNEQVRYSLEGINMFEYLNENHLNVKDYPFRLYHNVYD